MEYNLSKKELGYIRVAIKQARRSSYERFCHGAVLIKGGTIISTGFNTIKGSPFLKHNFPNSLRDTMHAEMTCLHGFPTSDLSGASLYVVRVQPNTLELKNSKPCALCEELISWYPLKKVIYSNGGGLFSAL